MKGFLEVSLLPIVDDDGIIHEPLRLTLLVEDIQIIFEKENGLCAMEVFRKNTQQGELLDLSTTYTQILKEISNFSSVEVV